MHVNTFKQLTAAAALALALVSAASAEQVKYTYAINWDSGELAGTTSTGSLAFDSSLVIPNAEYFGPDRLSDFSFTLRGSSYGLADVQTGFLTFDGNGELRLLGVGTRCDPGSCATEPGNVHNFYIIYDSQSQLDRFYGVASDSVWATSYGPGSLQRSAVPEPGALALLLAGLTLAGVLGRKRNR